MLTIQAKDVVGTAHDQTSSALAKLARMYMTSDGMIGLLSPVDNLSDIASLLGRALSDVYLAQHMLSPDWELTCYGQSWM